MMDKKVKLIMLALLFIIGFQPLSARERITEIQDSLKIISAEIHELQDQNKNIIGSISAINLLIHNQDSIISDFNYQIEKAKISVDSLDITRMDATIKNLKNEIEANSGNFIVIATNFLYVPYNPDNVDLALATYELARGTDLYDKYLIRRKLLTDYQYDTKDLIKFLEENTREKITMLNLGRIFDYFNHLHAVREYPKYGNGWEELYLGSIINDINSALKKAEDPKNAVDLDKVFTDNLKKLR